MGDTTEAMKLIPIQPKGFEAHMKALPGAVKVGMRKAAEAVKKDFELTVKGWEHPAAFTIGEQGDGSFVVGTDDQRWKWIDEGTPPHVIAPKRGKVLVFGVGGRPKTTPGRLTSGGGAKGNIVVIRPHVNHPGTKPRNFTELIMKRWRRGVQPFVRAAIEEALK
jgi:hypothetical protein